MIENVILDFGQVMVRFDPDYMVERYVTDPLDKKLLADVIFDRLYWDRLDAGTIEDSEVIAACCKRLPERLHDKVGEIYYNWIYNLPPIEGMKELVHSLKTQHGVGVYLLSNISTYFAEHSGELDVLEEFDGLVFSAEVGLTKPSREIFAYVTERFGIDPKTAIFIDDNKSNIIGAEAFGIRGYLFDGNATRLESFLKKEIGI